MNRNDRSPELNDETTFSISLLLASKMMNGSDSHAIALIFTFNKRLASSVF